MKKKHVCLISPSCPAPVEEVQKTRDYLNQYHTVTLLEEDRDLEIDIFDPQKDLSRIEHLKIALMDPQFDIVWSMAGGYGLSRVAIELLKMSPPPQSKLFIGFSDATVLHLILNQHWQWQTIHGPTARQFALKLVSESSIDRVNQIVQQSIEALEPLKIVPMNKAAKALTTLQGIVIGGNLSLIQTSIGTGWEMKSEGKIIYLEDIGERGYRIDRMLTHLEQAQLFKGTKAILLGDFIGGNEKNGETLVPRVLENFADNCPIPVFKLPSTGHGFDNFALPLNTLLTFRLERCLAP